MKLRSLELHQSFIPCYDIFWTLENFGRYVFGHYPQKFGDSGVTTLITQSQAKWIRK